MFIFNFISIAILLFWQLEANYRWLSFHLVMSWTVTLSTEAVTMESFPQGEYGVRFLWASGHNIVINWPIHNLVLCVFLFEDSLFMMNYWFMNIELVVDSDVTHAWAKFIYHIFSLKAHHSTFKCSLWPFTCSYLCLFSN